MRLLDQQHIHAIQALCRKYHVRRLDLFGSGTREDFDPAQSDVDFLVEFMDYKSPRIADDWFGLQEELKALLKREIDLVSLKAIRNPYFLEVANQSRVNVYAA